MRVATVILAAAVLVSGCHASYQAVEVGPLPMGVQVTDARGASVLEVQHGPFHQVFLTRGEDHSLTFVAPGYKPAHLELRSEVDPGAVALYVLAMVVLPIPLAPLVIVKMANGGACELEPNPTVVPFEKEPPRPPSESRRCPACGDLILEGATCPCGSPVGGAK